MKARPQRGPRIPSVWDVALFLVTGLCMLAMALVYGRDGDCGSWEVDSAQYRVVGQGMDRLCRHWGPLAPASIVFLLAIGVLGLAWRLWRDRRDGRAR